MIWRTRPTHPDDVGSIAHHLDLALPLAIAVLTARDRLAHERLGTVDAEQVLGPDLVNAVRVGLLDRRLDRVLGVGRGVGRAGDELIGTEDVAVRCRRVLLVREMRPAGLDLVEEGPLDEALVKQEGVAVRQCTRVSAAASKCTVHRIDLLVDNVDKVRAGGGAGSSDELLVVAGVPERDFLDSASGGEFQ